MIITIAVLWIFIGALIWFCIYEDDDEITVGDIFILLFCMLAMPIAMIAFLHDRWDHVIYRRNKRIDQTRKNLATVYNEDE